MLDSAKDVALAEVAKLIQQQQIITTFDPTYRELVAGLEQIYASMKQPDPTPGPVIVPTILDAPSSAPAAAASGPEKGKALFLILAGVFFLEEDDEQVRSGNWLYISQ